MIFKNRFYEVKGFCIIFFCVVKFFCLFDAEFFSCGKFFCVFASELLLKELCFFIWNLEFMLKWNKLLSFWEYYFAICISHFEGTFEFIFVALLKCFYTICTAAGFTVETACTSKLVTFRTVVAFYDWYKAATDMTFFYLLGLVFVFYDCCVTCNVSFFFVANYIAGNYVFVAHGKAGTTWWCWTAVLFCSTLRAEFYRKREFKTALYAFLCLWDRSSTFWTKFYAIFELCSTCWTGNHIFLTNICFYNIWWLNFWILKHLYPQRRFPQGCKIGIYRKF